MLRHRCHQISSVALCVELQEFLDNIFKMPIFKPILNFFEISKANMAKNSDNGMALYVLDVILLIRDQNL